jgi:hypothetical protein
MREYAVIAATLRCEQGQRPCASIAITSGVNVLALSRMLGHQSAKVTLDVCSDLFDSDLDAVAASIELKCAQSVPKRCPVASVEV